MSGTRDDAADAEQPEDGARGPGRQTGEPGGAQPRPRASGWRPPTPVQPPQPNGDAPADGTDQPAPIAAPFQRARVRQPPRLRPAEASQQDPADQAPPEGHLAPIDTEQPQLDAGEKIETRVNDPVPPSGVAEPAQLPRRTIADRGRRQNVALTHPDGPPPRLRPDPGDGDAPPTDTTPQLSSAPSASPAPRRAFVPAPVSRRQKDLTDDSIDERPTKSVPPPRPALDGGDGQEAPRALRRPQMALGTTRGQRGAPRADRQTAPAPFPAPPPGDDDASPADGSQLAEDGEPDLSSIIFTPRPLPEDDGPIGRQQVPQLPTRPARPVPTEQSAAPRLDLADNSVELKKVDKLRPEQRQWSENMLRVLNLPSKGSQARVVAGAIASAALVEQRGDSAEIEQAAKYKRMVIEAGPPPWKDAKKAMEVTAAKVQLDLLSIPKAERQLVPLPSGEGGENSSFWVNRRDPTGASRAAFLCKPATPTPRGRGGIQREQDGVPTAPKPSGGPRGGEVAREALSARAAQLLAGMTGIDIGMPETHVVKLDTSLVPGQAASKEPVTCSVQEARPSHGSLKGLRGAQLEGLNADAVARMAIFDTITLNVDRHAGNVLLGKDGQLVPIDHGESFAEPNRVGLARIAQAVGGPHNALLGVPSAHEPMSAATVRQVAALDPVLFAKTLAKDRDRVAGAHKDMDGMISDAAIVAASRSAAFVKMATKVSPPMSPAAVQVALGSHAAELLAPDVSEDTFLQRADEILMRVAGAQDVIKEVCLSSDAEYDVLCQQVAALGWVTQPRNSAPVGSAVTDPIMMVSIVQNKMRPRPAQKFVKDTAISDQQNTKAQGVFDGKEAAARSLYDNQVGAAVNPKGVTDTMIAIRRAAIAQLAPLINQQYLPKLAGQVTAAEQKATKEGQAVAFRALVLELSTLALEHQQSRLRALESRYPLKELAARQLVNDYDIYENSVNFVSLGNPIPLAPLVDALELKAGTWVQEALAEVTRKLSRVELEKIAKTDGSALEGCRQAINGGDPVGADQFYELMLTEIRQGRTNV